MKRENLEKYLHKKVRIKLFDGDLIEGYLRKTRDEKFISNPNLYIPIKYYFLSDENLNCTSCLFRTSHVKTVKEVLI